MKRLYRFTALALIIALISAAIPTRAYAINKRWRDAPTVTQSGVTYRYRDGLAVVTRLPNRKEVTVPYSIKVKGKTYRVRAIWNGAFKGTGKLKTLAIRANLETIEDGAIWDRRPRIKVKATVPSVYKWLKATGVAVTK